MFDKKKCLKKLKSLRNILNYLSLIFKKSELIKDLQRIMNDSINSLNINVDMDVFIQNYCGNKSKEILFILGSGASLNDLKPSNWAEISKNHSFALNNTLEHDFNANVYFLECGTYPEDYFYNYLYIEMLMKKSKRPICVFNEMNLPADISERNKFLYNIKNLKIDYFTQSPVRWPTTKKWLLKLLLYSGDSIFPQSNPNYGIHHNSSLGYVFNLGIRLKYRRIVLVGFDLNNVDYFFYHKNTAMAKQLTLLYKEAFKNRSEHRTNDRKIARSYNTITTPEWLELLYKHVALPQGTEVYIANPKSKLAEFLPTYTWEHL